MDDSPTVRLPWHSIDAAVVQRAEEYFGFLERLVRVPSVAGEERAAQELLASRLETLGFASRWIPLTADLAELPGAGRPCSSLHGRSSLVCERSGESAASVLINGHIDVVPAGDPSLWTGAPFTPFRRDGWMVGRGAGDMKGGLVMALLALHALHDHNALGGRISFVVVPEEESSGNGTLATLRAGVTADVAILPEPTDLNIDVSGIGVLWCEIEVTGSGAHAGGRRSANPLDQLTAVARTIVDLTAETAAGDVDARARHVYYNANLGQAEAGDWPSSVPTRARGVMRIGFPAPLSAAAMEERIRDAVARLEHDAVCAGCTTRLAFPGLRAEPHALPVDHPLVTAVAEAHSAAHATTPRVLHTSSTSDARFYVNQAKVPAVCYGPVVSAIHGVDEAVDLSSIVAGAKTYARLIPALLAGLRPRPRSSA